MNENSSKSKITDPSMILTLANINFYSKEVKMAMDASELETVP